MSLTRGTLGYRFDIEDRKWLDRHGHDPRLLLKAAETLPPYNPISNPLDILTVKNQGSVGACQGFALSQVFSVCYWLATGRIANFSAMAAYILSQKKDSIRGDRGSTLSGGNWVATEHGLCLDSEWPFRGRYDAREPSPKPNYAYRLRASKIVTDFGLVKEAQEKMLPVQWGISYGPEMDREIVENFTGRGGGGHSVMTWTMRAKGLVNCIGSWSEKHLGDGVNAWTEKAQAQMLRHKHTVAIIYGPEQMELPPLEPVA